MNTLTNVVKYLPFLLLNYATTFGQQNNISEHIWATENNPPEIRASSSYSGFSQCGLQRAESGRIIGGSEAAPGELPWQVSVQKLSGYSARHVCGGAVLSAYWAATAAHCVQDLHPNQLTVVAGDYDLYSNDGTEQRRYVVRVVTAGFDAATFARDLALLQLHVPLALGAAVTPLCLPGPGEAPPRAGSYALVSGWGRLAERGTRPRVLQRAWLPITDAGVCYTQLAQAGYSLYLGRCQLCAGFPNGGIDACQGDSGGPFACQKGDGRFYLCGIVSWGVGCGRPGIPGVYTDISCYVSWINSVLYGTVFGTLDIEL